MDVVAMTERVSPAEAERLLCRPVRLDTPATKWPTAPLGDDGLRGGLGAWSARLNDTGWLVLETGVADRDDDALTTVAWNAFTELCEPMAQYPTGELIHAVEVLETMAGSSTPAHYSTSDASGGYHTDGSMLSTAPDIVGLFCLSPASAGGETVLVDAAGAVEHLRAMGPRYVEALTRESPASDAVAGKVVRQPILGAHGFRYVRWFVEQGHARAGRDVPEDLRRALDALDVYAADPAHQTAIGLDRGAMLLFDNHRFLHGRLPFATDGRPRRLRRAYGRLRSR